MLVKYLRALLSQFWSKKDNDEIANLSAPKGESVTITPTKTAVGEWERFHTYTAPCSGWFILSYRISATSSDTAFAGLSTTKMELGQAQVLGGYNRNLFTRVAKGQNVTVHGAYLKEISLTFTKDN